MPSPDWEIISMSHCQRETNVIICKFSSSFQMSLEAVLRTAQKIVTSDMTAVDRSRGNWQHQLTTCFKTRSKTSFFNLVTLATNYIHRITDVIIR